MRIPRLALCLCVLLVSTGVCRGGLYSPAEQYKEILDPDYRIFRNTYLYFKNVINTTLDTPLRRKALLVVEVAPALDADAMTEIALLDVSAYLTRLGKHSEAIDLLTRGIAKFPDNFLLRSNLATAYFLASGGNDEDLMNRAIATLAIAFPNWPMNLEQLKPEQTKFVAKLGWKEKDYEFARKADFYLLRLMKVRKVDAAKLAAAGPGKKKELEKKRTVDALFTGSDGTPLRFEGADGYKPGKLPESELVKLPDQSLEQAIRYVEQLLVWMPLDERLYWQLGELVNANGFPSDTLEIFDTLSSKKDITVRKDLADEFKAHHQMLQEHVQKQKQEVAAKNQNGSSSAKPPPTPEAVTPDNWEDRWRFFGVGAGVGMVLTLFVGWQFRRLSRGRPRKASV
jgi:hypothetical protein